MISLFEYEDLKRKVKEGTASLEEKRRFQTIEAQLAREAPDDIPLSKFIKQRLKRLEG